MKSQGIILILLCIALLLSACTALVSDSSEQNSENATERTNASVQNANDLFSNRDMSGSYEEAGSARIQLNGSTASCDSNAVEVSGNTVTITDEGTYILSGSLDDGIIIVNAEKSDKTQLVLNGVSIHSETSAPIYVIQADKVFVTLAEGTENKLSTGDSFVAIDENNIDAVIFSKEDLTVNGNGRLNISSPGGHGIVSKDELTISGGSLEITSASHGLSGKDNVCISQAQVKITAGKDGIHGENDEDKNLGFVYIDSGTFTIKAEGDGISSSAYMQINNGTFDIVTGGGSVNEAQHSSDAWGSFMGGNPDRGDGGHPNAGGFGGGGPGGWSASTDTEEDSTSIKGIKSTGTLTIRGGSFSVDAADDAVYSNSDLTVQGGDFTLATGDDGFHADGRLCISSGAIQISECYEGLEGLSIDITGGEITLNASDDGLNAAGGADSSGFGGRRGGDMFRTGSSSDSYINISGGAVNIHASGDGIDSNGSLFISGGMITVCGPTNGDTAVLDFETIGIISGGTFIGTGAYMMAQTFSSSENQGVIAVSVGNQAAGTKISLEDTSGNILISYTPDLPYAIVILSSPDIITGKTYRITVGESSGEFAAS